MGRGFVAGLIVGLVCALSAFYVSGAAAAIKSADYNGYEVFLDGGRIDLNGKSLISVVNEGETNITNYMPLRAILEGLGYIVEWNTEGAEPKILIYSKEYYRETKAVPGAYMKAGFLVAHALGGIDGMTYTNSLEAFLHNYKLGHRVFEIDLQITSDNRLVAVHELARVSPESLFEEEKAAVPYTMPSFHDLCLLMFEYPDAYIITDTKYLDEFDNRRTFEIMTRTINALDPALINRFAFQFYNQEMYRFLKNNFKIPHENLIYTLYLSNDGDAEVAGFVSREKIRSVVMWAHRASAGFVGALNEAGAAVYAHTVNDKKRAAELIGLGVYGIYTDTLTSGDFY